MPNFRVQNEYTKRYETVYNILKKNGFSDVNINAVMGTLKTYTGFSPTYVAPYKTSTGQNYNAEGAFAFKGREIGAYAQYLQDLKEKTGAKNPQDLDTLENQAKFFAVNVAKNKPRWFVNGQREGTDIETASNTFRMNYLGNDFLFTYDKDGKEKKKIADNQKYFWGAFNQGKELPNATNVSQKEQAKVSPVMANLSSFPKEQAQTATRVYSMLLNKGYTPIQAAGIVGNLAQESGFKSGIISKDGKGSYGLAQWTSTRLDNLKKFAQKRGTDISDLNTQVDFLDSELKSGEYKKAFDSLTSAKTVEEATIAFQNDFERPNKAYANTQNRLKWASAIAGVKPTDVQQYGQTQPTDQTGSQVVNGQQMYTPDLSGLAESNKNMLNMLSSFNTFMQDMKAEREKQQADAEILAIEQRKQQEAEQLQQRQVQMIDSIFKPFNFNYIDNEESQ